MKQAAEKRYLGAEAEVVVYEDYVEKIRLSKGYRVKEIDDRLRKRRTKAEAKILKKLEEAKIPGPKLIKAEEYSIKMSKINGKTLRDVIWDGDQDGKALIEEAGRIVSLMHSKGLIHGDLTTMNFITCDKNLYVIDFGLSFFSTKEEDKAVDLYVFEKAISCVHSEELVKRFYKGYTEKADEEVLKKLEEVRQRGRKRE